MSVREHDAVHLALLLPTVAAGVLGTLAVRASRGLRRPVWVVVAVLFYVAATVGLSRLVQVLPVGVVYAVWAGLASTTLVTVDRVFFDEHLTRRQLIGLAAILLGVVLIDTQVG